MHTDVLGITLNKKHVQTLLKETTPEDVHVYKKI